MPTHAIAPAAVASLLIVVASCGGSDDPARMEAGVPPLTGMPGGPDAGVTADAGACVPVSGGATAGGAGAVPATFATVKMAFGGGGGIMPCSAAPCHGVNGVAPPDHPLELHPTDDQRLYTTLLSYVSKACNNMKMVEPCKPAQSALVTILKGSCGVTPRMPFGCTSEADDCIPADYIAAIETWIANGAPRQ